MIKINSSKVLIIENCVYYINGDRFMSKFQYYQICQRNTRLPTKDENFTKTAELSNYILICALIHALHLLSILSKYHL